MSAGKLQRPVPRTVFAARMLRHLLGAGALLLASLVVGMLGYVYFERFALVDAFLNAAMLLGGMGPVNPPVTTAGKVFAGVYALYAGLVFIISAALVVTPVAHRLLHKLRWDDKL